MSTGGWTFLSNHGHVLVCLARDPDIVMREVAEQVGITERAVQHIVHDLAREGFITVTKVGRRNRYTVNAAARLRHDLEATVSLGAFLELLTPER